MQEFLKIAFVLVTAPLWLPFLKAMRREIDDLFEDDGGLFGEDPGPIGRAAIRARRANAPGVVVHEWLAHVRSDGGRGAASGRRADQGSPGQLARRVAATPRTGQRSGQRPGPRSGPAPGRGDAAGGERRTFRR